MLFPLTSAEAMHLSSSSWKSANTLQCALEASFQVAESKGLSQTPAVPMQPAEVLVLKCFRGVHHILLALTLQGLTQNRPKPGWTLPLLPALVTTVEKCRRVGLKRDQYPLQTLLTML